MKNVPNLRRKSQSFKITRYKQSNSRSPSVRKFLISQNRFTMKIGTIGDTENWADVSFNCQNF
jgi:hypothetical protein